MKTPFYPTDLLLPDFKTVDGCRYAVVACDQFTSEPAYWEGVKAFVGDSLSTLNAILPEVYLKDTDRIPTIHAEMKKMAKALTVYPDSMIFLKRTQSDGAMRYGIVGAVDLEAYSYVKTDRLPIRATEETVLSRIPARKAVRMGGDMEFTHAMLLYNDKENKINRLLLDTVKNATPVYDFDLMFDGGHVTGYLLDQTMQKAVLEMLDTTAMPDGTSLAVGDGNHSLASAKATYEEVKKMGDAHAVNLARYASVELVNLYDDALQFEPIYRIIKNTSMQDIVDYLAPFTTDDADGQKVTLTDKNTSKTITLKPTYGITVETLQKLLDVYLEKHPTTEIDYIHGEDSVASLCQTDGTVGFLFDGITKDDMFPYIEKYGPMPRKTFSMGHAKDKRYYLEGRLIK